MTNIYESVMNHVDSGTSFTVDFRKKTGVLGKQLKVLHRKTDIEDFGIPHMTEDEAINKIEELYYFYKHSKPTERSDNQQRRYFNPLKDEDLSEMDLVFGESRDLAQARLEFTLLALILNKSLVWDEERMGKWFWQSKKDKDLIILREWVEGV